MNLVDLIQKKRWHVWTSKTPIASQTKPPVEMADPIASTVHSDPMRQHFYGHTLTDRTMASSPMNTT